MWGIPFFFSGFTDANSTWLPIASDYLLVNVETEMIDNASVYNMYKNALKLRSEDAFLSEEFKVVHVDRQVFAYMRGSNQYVVVINFSDKVWDEDLEELSGVGTVVYDSEDKKVGYDEQDVNKIKLNPGQVYIVKLK